MGTRIPSTSTLSALPASVSIAFHARAFSGSVDTLYTWNGDEFLAGASLSQDIYAGIWRVNCTAPCLCTSFLQAASTVSNSFRGAPLIESYWSFACPKELKIELDDQTEGRQARVCTKTALLGGTITLSYGLIHLE